LISTVVAEQTLVNRGAFREFDETTKA